MKTKIAVSLIAVLCVLAVGCKTTTTTTPPTSPPPAQTEAAALAQVISNSLSTLAVTDPANAAAYNKASAKMATVSTDITNWPVGAPVPTQITTGVNDTLGILAGIVNVSAQVKNLIVWADTALNSILAVVDPKSLVTTAKPITAAQYKATWNAKSPAPAKLP